MVSALCSSFWSSSSIDCCFADDASFDVDLVSSVCVWCSDRRDDGVLDSGGGTTVKLGCRGNGVTDDSIESERYDIPRWNGSRLALSAARIASHRSCSSSSSPPAWDVRYVEYRVDVVTVIKGQHRSHNCKCTQSKSEFNRNNNSSDSWRGFY